MFGSKPFGQSSSSAFVAQPVFGQTNNVSSNPFAPQPFGGMNSFGSQTVGSIFGGTSTGVFGPSPSLALGSGTPTFGASSGSAFGNSSSAFGGSSVFGQKPAFGSTTTQTSPFGSSFQQSQSQPAFGSNMLGLSTPFGAHPTSSFVASTPAFGSSTTSPPFGASAFGAPNTASAFSATSTSPFGNTATPSAPSFNLGSSPSFGQSTSTFGNTLFGTSSFGAQTSSFGAQTTTPAFGNPGFTQSTFGGQRGGSRVSAYSSTLETEGVTSTQPAGNLESISAMPVYKDKNHEELRWEDYQLGDKGGPAPASQITPVGGFGNIGFTSSSNPFTSSSTVASQTSFGTSNTSNFFGPKSSATPFGNMTQAFGGNTTPAFGQTSANPFTSSTTVASQTSFGTPNTSNFLVPTSSATPFGNTTQTFGGNTTPAFGQKSANPFTSSSTVASQTSFGTSNTSNFFSSTSSATLFGNTTQAFGRNSSPLFSSTTTPGFGTQSTFSPSSAQATTSAFGTSLSSGNTQLSSLFQSSTFTQNSTPFGQISSTFGQTAPAFAQTNLFSTPSTGFGNMFSSSPSLLNNNTTSGFGQPTPSHPTQFQSAQQPVFSSGLNVSNFGQAQSATTSGLGGTPGIFSNNTFGQPSGTQSSLVAQNPFGTLPTMPQISVGRTSNSPSVQYGISSLPVVEKPSPVRISSLLTSRHLTQRRLRMPVRKYSPQNDGPKVAFFTGDEETRNTLEVYASFVPRENPRALVTRLLEQQHSKAIGTPMHENGKDNSLENSHKDPANHDKGNQKKTNGVHNSVLTEKVNSYSTLTGDRADIEALIPKLRHSDYFTEPRVEELAAKERAEPGFCSHVNDFVVGRIGYGSIKFFGETDVRRLDLESLVQFNNREVIVYMDERKKPPVGQGLNKPAEVTLLNIKCFDKESGQQCTKGPRIEKYRKVLKRKAEDQGAEFVSYDPVKGEWKLRVSHFSKYAFGEEDESVVDVLSS